MEIEKQKLLEKIYHDPKSPAAFAGINLLYKEAKKQNIKITKKDILYFLEGDRTYTLHKPRRIHFKRSKTIGSGLYTDIQMDLADMQKISKYNKGFNYILLGVCVLSKMFFAVPVKSKKYNDMVVSMENILKQIPISPSRIFTDKGTEFILKEKNKNKEHTAHDFYQNHNIEKFWSSTKTIKAAIAERGIRTLKSRLYRYFSEKHTLNWVEVLDQIIDSINNTPSQSTGMKPVDVTFKNAQQIFNKLFGKEIITHNKKNKYKKGDHVRLANYREVFDKGYLPTFSDEILQIDSVKKGNPTTYKIKDDNSNLFTGQFYTEDLGKTRKDINTSYRIEKILSKRKTKNGNEFCVKFIGYPNPEWIKESDIVN
jgi:hypothetical protein